MSDAAALARLEGVCARLEALESRLGGGGSSGGGGRGGAAPAGSGGTLAVAAEAPFVKAFDELLMESFKPVESGAKACGPDVEKIVGAYKETLSAQRAMLVIAGNNKKPDQGKLQELLKPTVAGMEKVEGLKDRRSKVFNHLAMVAEGAACFQWVCIEPTPAPFLGDVIPGSEMYANKVIMEFKGKEDHHVTFAKDFKAFLQQLQKYVKTHHTTGLAWNPRGGSDYSAAPAAPKAGGPPPPPAGGPPPPPPPPPAGFFDDIKKNAAAPAPPSGGAAALFAEINAKGAAGELGLKKVSKDQMTHKNPALRASSVVPDKVGGAVKPAPGVKATAAKKPPKIEQQGSKWFIENQDGNRDLAVTDGTAKTSVCMVACNKSLLQISNKINTVQIDSCVKSSVVVESCVASIDIINCKGKSPHAHPFSKMRPTLQRMGSKYGLRESSPDCTDTTLTHVGVSRTGVEVQITDWTPMITIDGCAGVIVYLSQRCVDDDVAIITSKSSELNIVLPAKSEQVRCTSIKPVPAGRLLADTHALSHLAHILPALAFTHDYGDECAHWQDHEAQATSHAHGH